MIQVTIEEKGCRGCTMCSDICPVDVFDFDSATNRASVVRTQDCVGCMSCVYICPSQCVDIADVDIQRPFYRMPGNVKIVERFLQDVPMTKALSIEDWKEAEEDVAIHIVALSRAITHIMGRGTMALGRKSGSLSAAHLPEMYEETSLDGMLTRLKERFAHCFDFDWTVDGDNVTFQFKPCGLAPIVEEAGEKLGESTICSLFHDFWAGLLGAFTNTRYKVELQSCQSENCSVKLKVG
ncbi:MAG: ferredoxin family protein [Deltaproteobacteria bacterium]|nr:ferredoxin family protein [Deltaproteobacteria bacterium]